MGSWSRREAHLEDNKEAVDNTEAGHLAVDNTEAGQLAVDNTAGDTAAACASSDTGD